MSYFRPSVRFSFPNFNGFSPNLVCALILWRPGLGLLMGKFRQIFTDLVILNMLFVLTSILN